MDKKDVIRATLTTPLEWVTSDELIEELARRSFGLVLGQVDVPRIGVWTAGGPTPENAQPIRLQTRVRFMGPQPLIRMIFSAFDQFMEEHL